MFERLKQEEIIEGESINNLHLVILSVCFFIIMLVLLVINIKSNAGNNKLFIVFILAISISVIGVFLPYILEIFHTNFELSNFSKTYKNFGDYIENIFITIEEKYLN